MPVYLKTDAGDQVQLATTTGWGEVGRWLETQDGESLASLSQLVTHGWADPISELLKEVKTALKESPPADAETKKTLEGMVKTLSSFSPEGAVVVTDGTEEGDDDQQLAATMAMFDYAEKEMRRGKDPTPGLHALRDLIDDPYALDDLLQGTKEEKEETYTKCLDRFMKDLASGLGIPARFVKAWDESLHPRDKRGRFLSKDKLKEAQTDPNVAKELRARVRPEDAEKLEKVLSGEHDPGRTKKGQAKYEASERKRTRQERLDRVKEIRMKISRFEHTAEDLHELAEHIPHLTIAELRTVRGYLEQHNASFNGARRRTEMAKRLVEHATRIADRMELEARNDEIDPMDFGSLVDFQSSGIERGPAPYDPEKQARQRRQLEEAVDRKGPAGPTKPEKDSPTEKELAPPKSKATVNVKPGAEERWKALGLDGTPAHAADLIGLHEEGTYAWVYPSQLDAVRGPDGSPVKAVEVVGRGPNFSVNRHFYVDGEGNRVCYNASFFAKEQGTGLGTKVFTAQVEELAAAGFSRIETHAVGYGPKSIHVDPAIGPSEETANGYYTWARLGYDAPLYDVEDQLPKEFKDKKTVQELISTPEGRQWWKDHGSGLTMKFDLKEGSRSMQVLNAYLEAKAATKSPTSAPTTKTPSTEPGNNSTESTEKESTSPSTAPSSEQSTKTFEKGTTFEMSGRTYRVLGASGTGSSTIVTVQRINKKTGQTAGKVTRGRGRGTHRPVAYSLGALHQHAQVVAPKRSLEESEKGLHEEGSGSTESGKGEPTIPEPSPHYAPADTGRGQNVFADTYIGSIAADQREAAGYAKKLRDTGKLSAREADDYLGGDHALTESRVIIAMTNKLGLSEKDAREAVKKIKPVGSITRGRKKLPTYKGSDVLRHLGMLYDEGG